MIIGTVLVYLAGIDKDSDERKLEAARVLVNDNSGCIEGIHIMSGPEPFMPVIGEAMSAGIVEELARKAVEEEVARYENVKETFRRFCERYDLNDQENQDGMSACLHEYQGNPADLFVYHAHFADFVIMSRLRDDSSVEIRSLLHDIIFESGRPIVLIPEEGLQKTPRKVAIAWNGKGESARALTMALPLIHTAKEVAILTTETDDTPRDAGQNLVTSLGRRHIEASYVTLEEVQHDDDLPVAESILNWCYENDIDMLVMGAYTRSRLRRLIMGGVTRHVLNNSRIPVVMGR